MNPRLIISIAAAANEALPLAEKSAKSNWHYRQINRAASDLLNVLRAIENDDSLLPAIRREAADQAVGLRLIQRRICDEVEATQNQPIAL